jgi:hypothetical protein
MMPSLPSVLLTNLTWNENGETASTKDKAGEERAQKPEIAPEVFEYDPVSERPVYYDEVKAKLNSSQQVSLRKRQRIQLQISTPATPGSSGSGGGRHDDNNNDEDDGSSVEGGSTRGDRVNNKWQFEPVSLKLQAAYWEISKLSEVLAAREAVMTRLERVPLSHEERKVGLELGVLKRDEAFKKADETIKKGLENLERETRYQREYMSQLTKIAKKWKFVCPLHKISSLKPEERLAINLESGLNDDEDLVLLSRTSPTYGGVSLSSIGRRERDETDFRAHALHAQIISSSPPFRILGQASTALGSVVASPAETQSPANLAISFDQIVPVDAEISIDNRIESRFRDGHARAMMRSLGTNHELKLGSQYVLRFQLLPEASFIITNSYDAICSLALNLLERGKAPSTIQAVCLQKLMFPLYVNELAKTPCVSGISWKHDEDDEDTPEKVQSRCCLDIGRTGRYGAEFVLSGGNLTFDWCGIPGYRPKLLRPLSTQESLDVATEIASIALINELAIMVTKGPIVATKKKTDSFHVIDKSREDLLLFSVKVSILKKLPTLYQQQQPASTGVLPFIKVLVQFPDGASTTSSEDISESPYYLLRQVLAMQLPEL